MRCRAVEPVNKVKKLTCSIRQTSVRYKISRKTNELLLLLFNMQTHLNIFKLFTSGIQWRCHFQDYRTVNDNQWMGMLMGKWHGQVKYLGKNCCCATLSKWPDLGLNLYLWAKKPVTSLSHGTVHTCLKQPLLIQTNYDIRLTCKLEFILDCFDTL
jgi:hypothetical protein